MSVRWSDADLKAVGWTGTGFGNRRRVYKTPDGSLVDSRGLTVNQKDIKAPQLAAKPKQGTNVCLYCRFQIKECLCIGPLSALKRPLAPPKPKKVSKYRNVRKNGYASIKEADRAAQLKLLEAGGQIRNLREQVDFELLPKQEGERAAKYRADFCYDERDSLGVWHAVTEDVKGMKTQYYVLKRKLLLFMRGIRIRET